MVVDNGATSNWKGRQLMVHTSPISLPRVRDQVNWQTEARGRTSLGITLQNLLKLFTLNNSTNKTMCSTSAQQSKPKGPRGPRGPRR